MHRFHAWPAKTGPITVAIADGVTVHPDLPSAIKPYGLFGFHVSASGEDVLRGGNCFHPGTKARFYDGYGHLMPAATVMACVEGLIRAYESLPFFRLGGSGFMGRYDPGHFRCLPVPRTGKRGSYRRYRRIRTTQERRAAEGVAHDDDASEHGVEARASRNAKNLVSGRDDIRRGGDGRSWKSSRKAQWKPR